MTVRTIQYYTLKARKNLPRARTRCVRDFRNTSTRRDTSDKTRRSIRTKTKKKREGGGKVHTNVLRAHLSSRSRAAGARRETRTTTHHALTYLRRTVPFFFLRSHRQALAHTTDIDKGPRASAEMRLSCRDYRAARRSASWSSGRTFRLVDSYPYRMRA